VETTATGHDVLEKYKDVYPTLALRAISHLRRGEPLVEQDNEKATYFGRRTPEMGYIDFRWPFETVRNFIRAQAPPYPGAYCYLSTGQRVVVVGLKRTGTPAGFSATPFTPVMYQGRPLVQTEDGIVELALFHQVGRD
jgi:methionyl-tRNA formyltransferase